MKIETNNVSSRYAEHINIESNRIEYDTFWVHREHCGGHIGISELFSMGKPKQMSILPSFISYPSIIMSGGE